MGQDIEGDIRNATQVLMEFLCENTRINARHNRTIDFEIDQIRTQRFPAINDADHFNNILATIAERNGEISIKGTTVRLTPAALDNCRRYVANFQRDF